MQPVFAQLIIAVIAVGSLLLIPLVSRMMGNVGAEISRELDGGRSGSDLTRYLNGRALRTERDEEVGQLKDALDFLRRRRSA
jgi:hypothetical protein